MSPTRSVRPPRNGHRRGQRPRLPRLDRQARETDLAALKVRNATGQMVPLDTVAAIREVAAESAVIRVNLHRALIVSANPASGTTMADAVARSLKAVDAELSRGYRSENLSRPRR